MTRPQLQRDRTGENFARATQRLMRRCDQLSRRYGADFYVVVRRQHRHYDYCSTEDCHFPTRINMVSQTFKVILIQCDANCSRKRFTLELSGGRPKILLKLSKAVLPINRFDGNTERRGCVMGRKKNGKLSVSACNA